MEVSVLKEESRLFGRNIVRISDFSSVEDILQNEPDIVNEFNPAYIYCSINATNLRAIHLLEKEGFCFSEFRIQSHLNINKIDISTRSLYPFKVELIGDEEMLNKAIDILASFKDDDRFSNDPLIGPQFSKGRVIANLRKSFNSFPDEFLLGLFNTNTSELIAFRSGVFLTDTEVQYYQYGIAEGYSHNHYAAILEPLTINYLKQKGVHLIHSISSGFNIDELNRLIKEHEYKITSSHILMRKFY